jgi:hypothetical protein
MAAAAVIVLRLVLADIRLLVLADIRLLELADIRLLVLADIWHGVRDERP